MTGLWMNPGMTNDNGVWKINMDLKPGVYKYQFIIDGKWQNPRNTMKERNSFGDINSLIEIK